MDIVDLGVELRDGNVVELKVSSCPQISEYGDLPMVGAIPT